MSIIEMRDVVKMKQQDNLPHGILTLSITGGICYIMEPSKVLVNATFITLPFYPCIVVKIDKGSFTVAVITSLKLKRKY